MYGKNIPSCNLYGSGRPFIVVLDFPMTSQKLG
jgi:hypothetical protein